jgi:hypothetical protein
MGTIQEYRLKFPENWYDRVQGESQLHTDTSRITVLLF